MRPNLAYLLLLVPVPGQEVAEPKPAPARVDHAAFDAILEQVVRSERVDYVAVRDQHSPALQAYLSALAAVDAAKLQPAEVLAYWFNLYNASMIAAVVDRLRVAWSPAADDYAVFKAKVVRTLGGTASLDHVEHEILRKRFTEPRLHVALVCGARSCPPLLPRAYRGDDLDVVLEENMRRFVNDPTRNAADHEHRKLRLSRLFDWFRQDFGGEDGVRALVGRHLGRDVRGYSIDYLEYDWQLNLAPPQEGFLVAVTADAALSSSAVTDDIVAEVKAGELLRACSEQDAMTEVVVPRAGDRRGFLPASMVRRL